MKRQKKWARLHGRRRRLAVITTLILAGLFLVGNFFLWLYFRGRTYPGTRIVTTAIGSVSKDDLIRVVDNKEILPREVTLVYGDKKQTVPLEQLGIQKNIERTIASASTQRSWLPVVNLFKKPQLEAPIRINSDTLNAHANILAGEFRREPINAQLAAVGQGSDTTIAINDAKNGYELAKPKLGGLLVNGLDKGKTTVIVAVTETHPQITKRALEGARQTVQAQIKTPITYRFSDKVKQAAPEKIASWFDFSKNPPTLQQTAIEAYIQEVGKEFNIRVKDISGVASSTLQAISNKKSLDTTLVEQVALKTFTYCTAIKGVDASHLPGLKSRILGTLNDNRGWSAKGLVEFREVSAGCDFTVWLAASDMMPSFGAICDALWSCRVGPNVVINFDRWQGASTAWNANGGSLEEYRHMVLNHETGHWLGFGHRDCSGPGQPAPVMQQQSIDLQGCVFNAWPTLSEVTSLRRSLGI